MFLYSKRNNKSTEKLGIYHNEQQPEKLAAVRSIGVSSGKYLKINCSAEHQMLVTVVPG